MIVNVAALDHPLAQALPLEIVERKGIGHPDTICDALVETFSSGLSRFYLERFGAILHHNVDKALLCGGAARAVFGGGELTAPIEIHLAGRATCEIKGIAVPVDEIAIERTLNAPETKRAHPEIGADIKVMGARHHEEIALTIACAFVSRHIANFTDYIEKKSGAVALALQAARRIADAPIAVAINTADGDTPDSIYLTVTGLSAESGDDGQVGRGNRVNGLITPYRPMSLEAAAGKNPLTHVGKLYNVMAGRVAQAIVTEISQVDEAYCYLLSRIGHPIADPQLFDVKVRLKDAKQLGTIAPRISEVARDEFARIDSIWREAVDGTLQLW